MFLFLWGGMVPFLKKQNEKKNPGRSIIFSEKNIKDKLNAIVRFILSWSNMSKVLYGNKRQGCVVKKISRPKTFSCPA